MIKLEQREVFDLQILSDITPWTTTMYLIMAIYIEFQTVPGKIDDFAVLTTFITADGAVLHPMKCVFPFFSAISRHSRGVIQGILLMLGETSFHWSLTPSVDKIKKITQESAHSVPARQCSALQLSMLPSFLSRSITTILL